MRIKKGDKVTILLGKDRGKTGTVEYVKAADKKVFVSGANLYKRHVRKVEGIEGGIIDIPKPIDVSNVGLVCPSCGKITRVEFKVIGGVKNRICKKCGKELKSKESK